MKIKYSKNNRGFTLVELLVVLVLMGILLGTVLFAGLGWQDWAQFSKEEAVAEDIFFAAQNQLTELDASGALGYKVTPEIARMKALRAADANSPYKKLNPPIDDVEYRTGADDNTYDPENLWINSNPDDEKGELIMLRADAGDYDEYTKGTLTGEDKLGAKLLFDLVAEYVTDKNALNGAIILEFSPEAGQVFSVCYSDQADTLLYSGETASDGKKAISVMNRVLQDRRDIMLGYYSIDNLTQKVHGRSKNIAGLDFHIDNTDVLQFVVKDTKNEVPSDGNIVFDIYNENAKTPIMTVTISVAEAVANNSLLGASNNPANATVVFEDKAGKYAGQTVDFRIPSYKNGDTYYFIFDAADASAGTLSYSKSIYFGDAGTDADKQAFQNTYSFYRFGISENVTSIYADVSYTASGSTAKKGTTTSYGLDEDNKVIEAPNGVCTTFSSYSKSENDVSIDIKNMRHFYNMRYETDYKVKPDIKNTFNLKNNLSWKSFIGKGGSGSTNYYLNSYKKTDDTLSLSGVGFYGALIGLTATEDKTSNYPFPGFRKLDKNDIFTQSEDTNYAVSDLTITVTGNIQYGVYGQKIKNDCKNSFSPTQGYKDAWTGDKKSSGMNAARAGEMPLGLFAENQGEIKNITLNRHVVNGLLITPTDEVVYTCMVGGFAGNNLGKISNLTLLDNEDNDTNSTKANISKVNGRTDVGGIIGRESFVMEGKDRDVTISNMKNYATVSGLENVGGIVGRAYTRYVDAKGDESFANVYGAVKYKGSAISSFEEITDRYYRYHDGYKITDDYKSMTGDNVERCRYITIENCVNRGNVSGDDIAYDRLVNQNTKTYETGKNNASTRRMYGCAFIGGIAGITMDGIIYDDSEFKADTNSYIFAQKCESYVNGGQAYVTVKNCNSYVLCDSVTADDLTSTSKHKALLYDDYVGGLIGYSKMTSIENCNTKPDLNMFSGDNVPQTFVFGRSYVGGLIGCSDMSRFDISEGQNASQDGRDNYKYAATNYNNVIGVVSVGGIAGAFGIGDGQQESFNYSEPSTNERSMASQIYGDSGNKSANITRNLLNTGAVLCTKNKNNNALFYITNQKDSLFNGGFSGICGGITGMNRVSINNCDNIQSTEVKQFVTKLVFGDTNNHYTSDLNDVLAIDSENSKFGGNCSGGIVGYYNGNSRANTLEGAYSYVDAVVFGQNYVGGSFGISREGNKIFDLQNVYPYKKGNTSKGMLVIGQDIVGGLSGSLGRETSVEYDDPIEIPYTVKGRYAVGGITGIVGNNSANGTYYKITVEPESSVNVYGIGYVGGYCGVSTVNQLGTKNSKTVEISNMNLDGRYFTGGAYGVILDPSYEVNVGGKKETKDSIDFIKNIKIGSDVNVHSMIFAGGIAGLYTVETYTNNQDYVFKNKSGPGSLYNLVSNVCKDSASESYDSVVAADTNESNDIFDKTTERQVHIEFEDNTSSNIANVSAEMFAGGLFGYVPNGLDITIKGFENNGNVNTTGKKTISEKDYSYLGGVMGRVSSGVKLVKCSNLKNGENYNSVASYLGGLTEVNAGVISGDVTTDGAGNVTKVDYTENKTDFEYGSGGVGAFAGENNGTIQYCKNTAKVSANAGSSGGIAAVNAGEATIKYCVNTGSIGADQSQKSAGIVAEPSGTDSITYCRNYGEIKGSSRYGIAAGSAGTITKNLEAGGLTEATALHDPISANSANSLVNNFYIDQNNGSSSGSGSSGSAIVPPTIENNEGIVTYNVTSVAINSNSVYEKTNKYNDIVDTWIGNSSPLFKISYGISRSYGGDNNLGVKMSDFNIAWGAYNTTSNFVYCYDVIFTYNDANGTEQTTTVHRKDISLYGSTTIIDTIPAPQGVEITNVTLSMPYNEELKKHFPSGCNVLYKYAYWNDYNGKHFFMRSGENLSQNQDYISFDIKEQAGDGQVYNEWQGVHNSLYDSNPITNSSQLNNRKIWISGNDSYNSNRKITIDMDNSSTGHSMDYLKLYWYNEDAVNQKVYLYYVSFFYLDEDNNMQIVKYTRKFEGVPQDTFFYDKIPVTNENGNRIYPTSIVIDISALDKDGNIINDNKYSHNYILGGITWIDINNNERKLENFDHKFKLNDTDRRSYVDIDTSVYIDGAPYLVSDSQQVDTDHWSKRLINVNNSGKYYLYFMRNGEQKGPITTDDNISYDVMSDGYNSQKRFEVYDNWFINEFIDSPTYFGPGNETLFVGTN